MSPSTQKNIAPEKTLGGSFLILVDVLFGRRDAWEWAVSSVWSPTGGPSLRNELVFADRQAQTDGVTLRGSEGNFHRFLLWGGKSGCVVKEGRGRWGTRQPSEPGTSAERCVSTCQHVSLLSAALALLLVWLHIEARRLMFRLRYCVWFGNKMHVQLLQLKQKAKQN